MRHDPAHGLLAAVTIDASKVFETGSLLSTRKSSELFDYSTSFEGTLDQNMLRCQNGVLYSYVELRCSSKLSETRILPQIKF